MMTRDTDVPGPSGATDGANGGATVPAFAITFGDGPGPSTLPLLDCLRDFGVKCTFFILGSNVEQAAWCGGNANAARAVMFRALEEGHILGNHTYSHPSAARAARDLAAFGSDVLRGEAVVRSLQSQAGVSSAGPVPFSLPFGPQSVASPVGSNSAGAWSDPRLHVLAALGRAHLHWTAGVPDWAPIPGGAPELARQMIEHVESSARRRLGSVIALHDSAPPDEGVVNGFERGATVEAVRLLLEHARRSTWQNFTVPC